MATRMPNPHSYYSMSFNAWYNKFIHIAVIRKTVDCDIDIYNLAQKDQDTSLTKVQK